LSEGSGLRLTVAEWHTPSGHPIPQSGLVPDVSIAPNPSEPSRDLIIEAASQRLLERTGEQRQ
jgi:C-terminal processing protease CtpA/Prc